MPKEVSQAYIEKEGFKSMAEWWQNEYKELEEECIKQKATIKSLQQTITKHGKIIKQSDTTTEQWERDFKNSFVRKSEFTAYEIFKKLHFFSHKLLKNAKFRNRFYR
jgi:SMC interacting uncharacterized protein involved in chromosome segregation